MRKIKILIVDDEEVLRDVIEMILETEINATFLKAENGKEALTVINSVVDIDLIISDYSMPKMNGGELFLSNSKNIPFILTTGGSIEDYIEFKNFKTKNILNDSIDKPFDESKLIAAVNKIVKATSDSIPEQTPVEYNNAELIKVKLAYIMKYPADISNVYIQLSAEKFIKIADNKDAEKFRLELLEHYQQKRIEYVYIEKNSFLNLIKLYKQNLFNYKNPEEKTEIAGMIFHLSLTCLETLGLNQFQIDLTNDIISETVEDLLRNNNNLTEYQRIYQNEGFIIGHSLLLIYIASSIVKSTQLNYTSTMKKISLAAFIHDMSLESNLAEFELDIETISDHIVKEKILKHPLESSKLIGNEGELFEETKRIILEHHEKPNGTGYPKQLHGSSLSAYSCLFILAHDIATQLIRSNYSKERLIHYLKNHDEYYSYGHFKKFYLIAITNFL